MSFQRSSSLPPGSSIQDPRERPMDQKEAAEQAHRRFANPQSDFLTLLKNLERLSR